MHACHYLLSALIFLHVYSRIGMGVDALAIVEKCTGTVEKKGLLPKEWFFSMEAAYRSCASRDRDRNGKKDFWEMSVQLALRESLVLTFKENEDKLKAYLAAVVRNVIEGSISKHEDGLRALVESVVTRVDDEERPEEFGLQTASAALALIFCALAYGAYAWCRKRQQPVKELVYVTVDTDGNVTRMQHDRGNGSGNNSNGNILESDDDDVGNVTPPGPFTTSTPSKSGKKGFKMSHM